MKISSFFKPLTRQFAKSTTKPSAGNSSHTSTAAAYSDKVAGRYSHSGESAATRAAVSASALQSGLVSPMTQQAAQRAAGRKTKASNVSVNGHQKAAAAYSNQGFVRQAGSASTVDQVTNAAIAAHSKVDGTTMAAAQRAAKPLSLFGKVRAFFNERNS